MPHASDPYPTRLHRPAAPVPRLEPAVRGRRSDGPLDDADLERFERDGFLVLEGFFPDREMRRFLDDLDAYATDPGLADYPGVIREPDSGSIRSIFAIHEMSARFDALVRDRRLLGIATQVLGSEVYIHQSRINRKPAFRGRGFDWHSDFETWHAEDGMPRMRCVSISVTLTENHESNGPLMLVPGSHRTFYPTVGATPPQYWETSLKRQNVGVPEPADLARAIERGGLVRAEGGPGTVVVFDCNTLHASADNLSPAPRCNLFFVYNSVENAMQRPFAAPAPRPAWLAARQAAPVLSAHRRAGTRAA